MAEDPPTREELERQLEERFGRLGVRGDEWDRVCSSKFAVIVIVFHKLLVLILNISDFHIWFTSFIQPNCMARFTLGTLIPL